MSNIISGVCGKCHKYFTGSWCSECEKINVDKTLNFIMDFHDSYYDHALGQVITSRQHRKRVMKEKGLFEIGNEWKYIDPEVKRREQERKEEKDYEIAKQKAIAQWK